MDETKPLSVVTGDARRGLSPGSQPRGIRREVENHQTGPQGGGLCLGGRVRGSAVPSQALAWVVRPRGLRSWTSPGLRSWTSPGQLHRSAPTHRERLFSTPGSWRPKCPGAGSQGHCPLTKPPPGWCPVAACSPPCVLPPCCLLQNQRWGKPLKVNTHGGFQAPAPHL